MAAIHSSARGSFSGAINSTGNRPFASLRLSGDSAAFISVDTPAELRALAALCERLAGELEAEKAKRVEVVARGQIIGQDAE